MRKCRAKRLLLAVLALSLLLTLVLCPAMPAWADDPPPDDGDEDGGIDWSDLISGLTSVLPNAFREALEGFMKDLVEKPVQFVEEVFSSTLGRWVTLTPGIATPSGAMGNLDNIMRPTWDVTVVLAVCLMPLTLAITAAIAAKDVVAARSWGIGDLRQAIFAWFIAAAAAGTSIHWMDVVNRITNGMTRVILEAPLAGVTDVGNWAILTDVLLGGAVAAAFAGPAGILLGLVVLLIGGAILAGLVFSFYARFALLYVLVAVAPILIVLGTLGPAQWLHRLWMKGFGIVLLVGPVNALLLKLAFIMARTIPLSNPVDAIIRFICTAGILSLLLMITGQVVRSTFGAILEVAEKAAGTVMSLVTMALAAVGAVAGAGALGAGGAAAAGTGAGGAAAAGKGAAGGAEALKAGAGAMKPELAGTATGAKRTGLSGLKSFLGERHKAATGAKEERKQPVIAGDQGGGDGRERVGAGSQPSSAEKLMRRGDALSAAGSILSASQGTRRVGFALRGLGGLMQQSARRAAAQERQADLEAGTAPPSPGQLARMRSLGAQVGRSSDEIERMVSGVGSQAEANAAIANLEGQLPATRAQRAAIQERAEAAGHSLAEARRIAEGVGTQSEARQIIDDLSAGSGVAVPAERSPQPGQLARIRSLGAQVGKSGEEVQGILGGATTYSGAQAAIASLEGQLPATRAQRDRIEDLALGAGYSGLQAREMARAPVMTRAEAQGRISSLLTEQPGGGAGAGAVGVPHGGAQLPPGLPSGAGSWAQRGGEGVVRPSPYTQGAPRVEDGTATPFPPVMASGVVGPGEPTGGPRGAPPAGGGPQPGAGMPTGLGPVPEGVEGGLGAGLPPGGFVSGRSPSAVFEGYEPASPATDAMRARIQSLGEHLGMSPQQVGGMLPEGLTQAQAVETMRGLEGRLPATDEQRAALERLSQQVSDFAGGHPAVGMGDLTRGEAAGFLRGMQGVAEHAGLRPDVAEDLTSVSPAEAPLSATPEQRQAVQELGDRLSTAGAGWIAAQASRGDLQYGEAQEVIGGLQGGLGQLEAIAAPHGVTGPVASPPIPHAAGVDALSPGVAQVLSHLDSPLAERARPLVLSQMPGARQQVADAIVAAVSGLEARGAGPEDIAAAWDEGLGTVVQAAQGGLPLHVLAHDEEYQGASAVTDFIGAHLERALYGGLASGEAARPQLMEEGRSFPWHRLPSAHDWGVGSELAALTGDPGTARAWAGLYHDVRGPDGGGWPVGQDLIRGVRETVQQQGAAVEGERAAIAAREEGVRVSSQDAENELAEAIVRKLAELQESGIIPRKSFFTWQREMRRRRRS